jgi:hypothetical protein
MTDSVLPATLVELIAATVTEPISPKNATPIKSKKDKNI